MDLKYIEKLEYFVILDKLSTFCATNYGKELCHNLRPSSTKNNVLRLLQETSEATLLLTESEPYITNIR